MSEWAAAFKNWLEDKTNSPLYWTYALFFILWNWKFFHILFIESSGLLIIPRIVYIKALEWNVLPTEFQNGFLNILWRTVPPILFTYSAIRWLPIIHDWAFKIHTENIFKRRLIFQEQNTRYIKEKARLMGEEEREKGKIRVIRQAQTEEEKWTEEFHGIKSRGLLIEFANLVRLIYGKGGVASIYQIQDILPNFASVSAFAGAYGLIASEKESGGSTTIRLTEKGKYFARMLTESRS